MVVKQKKGPAASATGPVSEFSLIFLLHRGIYTDLLPYDFSSCKRRHQHVFTINPFMLSYAFSVAKVYIYQPAAKHLAHFLPALNFF